MVKGRDLVDILTSKPTGCTCRAWSYDECSCISAVWPEAYISDAAEEIKRLRAVVDALVARPFRGSKNERRYRMYGSDWEAVHDALDALEDNCD
jgi:hypothetical protein